MIYGILRNLLHSVIVRSLVFALSISSLVVMSFHLTLFSIEEDFISTFLESNIVEQESSIQDVLMKFQEAIYQVGGDFSTIYRPHSGLPIFGYSEIIDFALLRIYDCGHAVALFNRAARDQGVDCGPITVLGSGGGHVISFCEVDENIVYVDPFHSFIYRDSDGTFATQDEIISNWEYLVREAENAGIRSYPIESFRVRNPEFFPNRVVDFFVEQGLHFLELFSFRGMIVSTHLFLAGFFGVAGLGLWVLLLSSRL